jgi:hypothetical protein
MTKIRLGILFGIVGSVMFVGSCKSDDEPGEDYRDNRGRVCQIDISIPNQPATCNVEPRPTNQCPAEAKPCFTVSPTLDSVGQVRNCDACCVNNVPGIPDFRDCGQVTCVTDGDCLYPNGRCIDSFCYRPGNGGAGGASGAGAGGGSGGPAGGRPSGGTGPTGGAPQGGTPGASSGAPAGGGAGTPSGGAFLGVAGGGAAGAVGTAGTPSGMSGGGSGAGGSAGGAGRASGGQGGGATAGRPAFPAGRGGTFGGS